MVVAATAALGRLPRIAPSDQELAETVLRAAGVAELVARVAKLEAELATHQESTFHPDWSLLEATRGSLREHQEMIRSKDARIAELEQHITYQAYKGAVERIESSKLVIAQQGKEIEQLVAALKESARIVTQAVDSHPEMPVGAGWHSSNYTTGCATYPCS